MLVSGGSRGLLQLRSGAYGGVDHRLANGFGAFKIFSTPGDAQPTALVAPGTLQFGDGSTAPNMSLNRDGSGSWRFRMPANVSYGMRIDHNGSDVAIDAGGSGGFVQRMQFVGRPANGVNESTRGDSIIIEAANGVDHTAYSMLDFSNGGGSWGMSTRGSFHQITGGVDTRPYEGGGDAYCESFNMFFVNNCTRKGALVGNMEASVLVASGFPARACGTRMIITEQNALSAYTALGGLSPWNNTGSRGFEAISNGTQRAGTGMLIHGSGWEWALQVRNTTGSLESGIDGNGGVFTRTKSGVPSNGDFRQPIDGLLAVDTVNHHLYFRSGGTWRRLVPA